VNTKDLALLMGADRNGHGETAAEPMAIVTCLADVMPQPVEWLWPGRFPLGKLSLVCGDPGLGKSFVTLDMAARVSSGTSWPDRRGEANPAGGVIILSAEDDVADTIRPRLDAAGADVARISTIEGVQFADNKHPSPFNLLRDTGTLEQVLNERSDVRLVIIDPISAYMGKTDSHVNAEVRSALSPLSAIAARRRVAFVLVTHLSKTMGTRAIYRAMGSLAFAAAARAVWLIVEDAEDAGLRLVLPLKSNLAEPALGMGYRIVGSPAGPVVGWMADPVAIQPDQALTALAKSASKERSEAAEWLEEILSRGPKSAKEVFAEARLAGFARRTIFRAKEGMRIKVKRSGFGKAGEWAWELANGHAIECQPAIECQLSESGTLCENSGENTKGCQPLDSGTLCGEPDGIEPATDGVTAGPAVPDGWSPEGWTDRLRQLADRCEDLRPDLAGDYRQQADALETTTVGVTA